MPPPLHCAWAAGECTVPASRLRVSRTLAISHAAESVCMEKCWAVELACGAPNESKTPWAAATHTHTCRKHTALYPNGCFPHNHVFRFSQKLCIDLIMESSMTMIVITAPGTHWMSLDAVTPAEWMGYSTYRGFINWCYMMPWLLDVCPALTPHWASDSN